MKSTIAAFLIFLFFPLPSLGDETTAILPINYQPWTTLLQRFVNDEGKVNYSALKESPILLDSFLSSLEKIDSRLLDKLSGAAKRVRLKETSGVTTDQRQFEWMALWINTYNALLLRIVLDAYPIQSIEEIADSWGKARIIAGRFMNLRQIKQILLKSEDPRVLFALLSATRSGAVLIREPYHPTELGEQLEKTTQRFFQNEKNYFIDRERKILYYSGILDENSAVFKKKYRSILAFIYRNVPLIDQQFIEMYIDSPLCRISSLSHLIQGCMRPLDYDWRLNDWRAPEIVTTK